MNTVPGPTVEVPCFCARKHPTCTQCRGSGVITKRSCQRCGGMGNEGGATCFDCRGAGYREMDQYAE